MPMTKKEMAVAVAQDVISQLKKRNNKMRVEDGYGYFHTDFRPDTTEGDLKDILPEVMKAGCTVCARGAALLSKARLFDKVPVDKVFVVHDFYNGPRVYVDQEDTTELLSSVFNKSTLDAIEAAFEMSPDVIDTSNKKIYGAVLFGLKYKDPKKRLIAIMQNIVDNNDDFVVPPATKEVMYDAMEESYA